MRIRSGCPARCSWASPRSSGSSFTRTASASRLDRTRAADNFRNLFELPVLFYLLCVAIAITGGSTPGFVAAARAYAGLRDLHSLIHVTCNRVMHRFPVYAVSMLLLFGMWAAFLWGIVW